MGSGCALQRPPVDARVLATPGRDGHALAPSMTGGLTEGATLHPPGPLHQLLPVRLRGLQVNDGDVLQRLRAEQPPVLLPDDDDRRRALLRAKASISIASQPLTISKPLPSPPGTAARAAT